MDKYKIDSHKLIYHVNRVSDWLKGRNIYPIYIEISPSGACNYRCIFCGLDFMGYKPHYLETGLLKERVSELGRLGLKSIMYAGEGEPFLHKDIVDIINHTKHSGIDVGITTNAVLFKKDIADNILPNTEWIKASVNAATPETSAKIHRSRPENFNYVIKNMTYAAKIKRQNSYSCTLGMQLLLIPENDKEVIKLAKLARDIGMDYLVVKPYSQHPKSSNIVYKSLRYSDYEYLADEMAKFSTKNFNVIFRTRTMKKWDKGTHDYKRCYALPFMCYIDSKGNVWGCCVNLDEEQFLYGNIYHNSFQDIWEGETRRKLLRWFDEKFDATECRINCRLDEINTYLRELKNPPQHVNFI